MRLYYRKLVIILLLVSIIPIASYGVLFYKYSERKLEDEIMQNNTIALWNVSSIIDEKLDSLKADLFNFSLQNNYYLAYSYNDRIKRDERVSEITRLYVEINRIKSKHPYVNDIVLYYSQSDNVITSLGSMSVDLFLNNRMERDDFDLLCGFPKRFETILINNVIYISTTLPFNSLNPNAYIFIVLSRGEVQQEFDKIKIANNPIVATYFNDRNMFLLGGGDLSKNEIDSITEYMLDESKRTYIDDKYSVSQIYSESNGWEYLAFIPKKFINDKINILKYLNIILVASLLLIALILSVTMSKSLYKPLKGLLRKFGSDRKIRNEFDYLITNIDKIVLNNKVLEKKVLSSIPAIRERFIYNLLHESPEDFNESELGLYNFDFRGDKYAIAAFIYTFNKNETENIISRIFKDVSGFQIYTLDVDDILIAVLNFDSKISSLNQLIEHMKDHGIIKCGISNSSINFSDLYDLYNQSKKCIEQITNKNCTEIIRFSELDQRINYISTIDPQILKCNILNLLMIGDHKIANDAVEELLDEIFQDGLFLNEHYYRMEVYARVIKDLNNVLSIQNEDLNRLINNLIELKNLHYFSNLLNDTKEISRRILAFALSERKDDKWRIVNNTLKYINMNYKLDISLDNAASREKVSYSYLSRIFNECTGQKFTEYLTNLRIEKAKEMLIKSNMSIEQVATESGYNSSNTFIKVFKKYTGMTPGKFKTYTNGG